MQRPEALESLMIMWRVTKDPAYRSAAWDIFQAFVRHCRVQSGGFTGLKNVGVTTPQQDDLQQTFWLVRMYESPAYGAASFLHEAALARS